MLTLLHVFHERNCQHHYMYFMSGIADIAACVSGAELPASLHVFQGLYAVASYRADYATKRIAEPVGLRLFIVSSEVANLRRAAMDGDGIMSETI